MSHFILGLPHTDQYAVADTYRGDNPAISTAKRRRRGVHGQPPRAMEHRPVRETKRILRATRTRSTVQAVPLQTH